MNDDEESSAAVDEEERARILRERARKLALRPREAESAHRDILEFTLSGESYGIELACISEVYPMADLTPIPCAPGFVLGVVNIRGRIFSVIDLRRLFGLASAERAPGDKVIVMQDAVMEFGIRAELIVGTRSVPSGGIRQGIPTLDGTGAGYLKGITDDHVAVLDGEKMLGDAKLIVHEDVA